MGKKIVDFNKTARMPFSFVGTKNRAFTSGKEMMKQKFDEMTQMEELRKSVVELMPAVKTMMGIKLKNRSPLNIVRPFQYQTSELQKSDNSVKFVDVVKQVMPGDVLIIKSLDAAMQTFIFINAAGEEVEISYIDGDRLAVSTDIVETVKKIYGKE